MNQRPSNGPEGPKRAGDYSGPEAERIIPKMNHYPMDIQHYAGHWKYFPEYNCRYLKGVVYCETPKEQNLQNFNLFVPKAYLNEDGSVNLEGVCGRFTAETAPIIMQSSVMGYSEAPAGMLRADGRGPDQKLATAFLASGMIYCSVGVRGRQTQDAQGNYVGKAPALLTDVKAALRFYRHNKTHLPGNTDRIIFVGVSAGGNLAALVGSTCDRAEFEPGLREIGAVMDESDAVYASQCYCPITALSHADMAYEWMFRGQYKTEGTPIDPAGKTLTAFQRRLSEELAVRYIRYVNDLGLSDPATGQALTLGSDGRSGTFYDALLRELEASATKYLRLIRENSPKVISCTPAQYVSGDYTMVRHTPGGDQVSPGIDKSTWLSWDGEAAHITGLSPMLLGVAKRMKNCPAFDSLDLQEFENEEFGPSSQKLSHFNRMMASVLEALQNDFPEESEKYLPTYRAIQDDPLLMEQEKLLNPHSFIGTGTENLCSHFRIRAGSMDPHTSFSTAMLLAYNLKRAGADVDFAFVWEAKHGVCDYEGELMEWIQSIL